jgi:hypothetical protein
MVNTNRKLLTPVTKTKQFGVRKTGRTDRALLLALCLNREEVESCCIIKLPISRSGGEGVSLYQQQQGNIHRPEIK